MALPRSSLTFPTMKNTQLNLLLLQGLVILFVSDIVTSHGTGEITEEGSTSNPLESPEPQLDRSGSVNTRSANFIEAEKQRMLEERLAEMAGHHGQKSEDEIRLEDPVIERQRSQHEIQSENSPIHERRDSTDSLIGRSEDFIKRNRKEIAKGTPVNTPFETPIHPSYEPDSPDYHSDPEDMKKMGCLGNCLSFKSRDKTS